MRSGHGLYIHAAVATALGGLLLGACAPAAPPVTDAGNVRVMTADARANGEGDRDIQDGGNIRFQFIYVIHGDAGYTYYDQNGERRRADLDAVTQAETVARNSPAAEVFIFHQKPVPFLRFFHGSDGTLRQYRNGRPVRTQAYRRAADDDELQAEAALFLKYSVQPVAQACPVPGETSLARVFLYFGHEIPVTGGIPYSRSRLDTSFSLPTLARGLEHFGGAPGVRSKPFSLIILSACHGGTPAAMRTLAPYAPYLLASPGELHLSYLDTRPLARLTRESSGPFGAEQAGVWGRVLAEASFARLETTTSTAITLSLYDTEKASAYLNTRRMEPFRSMGNAPNIRAEEATEAAAAGPQAYHDCAEDPAFGDGGEQAGVTVYYRAPQFGAEKSRGFTSGWECPGPKPDLARICDHC